MNPNHDEDLPFDSKSLSIIIHDHTSCPTDLRQTANSGQRHKTMLGNSHDCPAEKPQKEAQLCELKELRELAKEKLLAHAQMQLSQTKNKKIETTALHSQTKETTTEQTEKLQQMVQGFMNHNPAQTQQQAFSVYKHLVAAESRKGIYPGGLPEQAQKKLQMQAQA